MSYKTLSASIVAVSALVILSAISVQATNNTNLEQRLIVTFNKSVTEKSKIAIRGVGAVAIKELPLVNSVVVTAQDNATTKKLEKLEGIKSVEIDTLVHAYARKAKTPPAQPLQQLPWGIDNIDAEKSWSVSSGAGIKIAVIDTGIDKNHPDLTGNIAGGINFTYGTGKLRRTIDPNAWDDNNGHGTHVAGTIAAINNTIGVVGIAPEARLYGVKALDNNGSGYVSDIISGIEWSINNNINVINMSLGSSSDNQAMHDAVDAAYSAGIVVVAAAGNSGDGNSATNEVGYPAKYSSVIAVAATYANNNVVYFSSDGSEVEIAAPGYNILSTTMDGSYGLMSGTSMASPHVAGAIATALAAHIPQSADINGDNMWSASEVRTYMQVTSDDMGTFGRDVFYGYGLIDVEELVTGIQTQ